MQELQVPTRRIRVEVVTFGQRLEGVLFLSCAPYQSGRPEDVAEVLNDGRAFVPFETNGASARHLALNKQHILRVHVHGEEDATDAAAPGADDDRFPHPADIVLADGSRVSGEIVLDTPPSAARLLDKLNLADRFLAVRNADGFEFVQRDHIVHVE